MKYQIKIKKIINITTFVRACSDISIVIMHLLQLMN